MFRIKTVIQGLLAAAALGATLSIAAPAGAVTLLSAAMDTSNTAYIKGGVYGSGGINVYIGPVTFSIDSNPKDDITGYCIDIYHDMFLGSLNGGAGYGYHDEALKTDSSTSTAVPAVQSGLPVAGLKLQKIEALVDYGAVLTAQHDADLSHELAGIQGAIWQVEYGPTYTVQASSAVQHYINTYAADAAVQAYMPAGTIRTLFADDFAHQAFAFASSAPEPASWVMMILGFGGIGAAMRRRRAATAFA